MKASTLTDLIKALTTKKGTSPYDTQATVRRVEGNTLWVHIPGGVDETPVQKTVNAKPGDTVQVRVGGGRAWLVGNASAPPTDDTVAIIANETADVAMKRAKKAQVTADEASKIAGNTNQYFWHTESGTDTGVHITEVPQEEFLADPTNGGGNLLARSNGIAVRDGLTELAEFSANGIAFRDANRLMTYIKSESYGNDSVTTFAFPSGDGGTNTVIYGMDGQIHIVASPTDDDNSTFLRLAAFSPVGAQTIGILYLGGDRVRVECGNLDLQVDSKIRMNTVDPLLKVSTQYGGQWTIAANSYVGGNFAIESISGYSPIGIIGSFPDNGTGSGETSAVVNRVYMNDVRTTVYYGMRNLTSSQINVRCGVKILYVSTALI